MGQLERTRVSAPSSLGGMRTVTIALPLPTMTTVIGTRCDFWGNGGQLQQWLAMSINCPSVATLEIKSKCMTVATGLLVIWKSFAHLHFRWMPVNCKVA